MEFFVVCKKETRKVIVGAIQKMGGKVGAFVHGKTAAIISDTNEIDETLWQFKSAKSMFIQVVPVDFLDAVKKADPFLVIKQMNMSPWKCKDVGFISRNG